MNTQAEKSFTKLLTIMDQLREQCPWDKKQTIESLRIQTIEELYELNDAILHNDMPEIKKELGDVLLHIIFYAKIASETQDFTITDVIESLTEKLIYRHPHVFANENLTTDDEVRTRWEELKLLEKGRDKTVLGGVPQSLPSMIKALRIQKKTSAVGFDWQHSHEVWNKVTEELQELSVEIESQNSKAMEEEFGDLFFALINAARLYNINPDTALEKTNTKFIRRFNYIEAELKKRNIPFAQASLDNMEALWQQAKRSE